MDNSKNEDIKYCLGCLSHSSTMSLYCYKLQIRNLKGLMQGDCLYLCYICKRLMEKAEQFIECVNYHQLVMQNVKNVENISSRAPKVQYQFSAVEKVILEKIKPNDENDIDDSIYKVFGRSVDNKMKIELKEENIDEESHDFDIQESTIEESPILFDNSVKEENVDIDDMCLYELREVLAKSGVENETNKTKRLKPCKETIKSKENEDLPLKIILDEENTIEPKIRKYKKKFIKTRSIPGDKCNNLNLVACVLKLTREQIMLERTKMLEDPKYVDMTYKCDDCVKGFRYKDSYDNHMLKHSKTNGDHECDICKQRMKTLEHLLGHQRYHRIRYKCIECDLIRIDKLTIREHYTSHHLPDYFLYRCSLCAKGFKRQVSLRKHMINRHTPHVRQKCNQCPRSYANKEALKTHVINKHLDKIVIKKEICNVCGAGFTSPSRLKAHMMKHIVNKNYYCVECNRKFKSHHGLNQHLKVASPHVNYKDLPFQCDHCEKRFGIKRDVWRHMNSVHLNIKPYQCDKCDKAYVSSSSLTEHTRFVHEGYKRPKIYACPMCDRVFDRAATCKVHIRTHTGERPYKCQYCEATFSQSSIRATHVRLVHLRLTRDGKPKRPLPERESTSC